jgi:hypothetical protein
MNGTNIFQKWDKLRTPQKEDLVHDLGYPISIVGIIYSPG